MGRLAASSPSPSCRCAGAGARRGRRDVEALKRLPVQHDGRVMPLDTLARETVWNVTGSHSWNGEDPAATFVGWLLDPKRRGERAAS